MKLDLTHDMYLPDPPRKRSRPTPARERNIDTFADPNGSKEQREAWMRSRRVQEDAPAARKGRSIIDALVHKHFEQMGWKPK